MTGRIASEPVPILLVEDDPGDAALIGEAFASPRSLPNCTSPPTASWRCGFRTRPASSPARPGPP
jgi:hypothetical protein